MRVLIVGCGYVGLPLGAELARQGHRVFGLRRDAGTSGEMVSAGIQPLAADVTDPASLAGLPRDYDWVVNTVSSSKGGAEDYRRVYLEGTRHLVAWLAPTSLRKFVYTSSTGVHAQDDGSVVDESSPAEPETDTSRVLLETEQVLLSAARERGFPAVILRVAGIYGPGRGFHFKQFVKNEAMLTDGGRRLLNMIHRDDVVGAILAALARGQSGEIYNAVDDQPVSQLEFYQWLAKQLHRPMPGEAASAPSPAKRAATNKFVSNRRLRQELGYQFTYPTFREGYASEVRGWMQPEG